MIVVVEPIPAIEPGLIVHVPVAGNPLSTTLPVGAEHEEGCEVKPTIGADGASGAGLIITSIVASEVHPSSIVIVKL